MPRFPSRRLFAVIAASSLALALSVAPTTADRAAAATTKVVIVVGPVGDSQTATYINLANSYASVARRYTSNVITIYSPHATWSAVSSAARGANILVYLGHGNGFPSPYSSTLNYASMDGFGLNATDNNGNYNWAYYGESYVNQIRLAPNAAVIFSRLCYASGDSEWGAGTPSFSVAKQRVDNYAAPFINAGAKAVIADGLGDAGYYIAGLFTQHTTVDGLYRSAPNRFGNYAIWSSSRSSGYTSIEDVGTYSYVPDGDPYYRSMVSVPSTPTDLVIGTSLEGRMAMSANLRTGPSTGYSAITAVGSGTYVMVTGAFRADSSGRTWAPVRLPSGRTGWIASNTATYVGSVVPTVSLNVRSWVTTSSTILTVAPAGVRVTVLRSSDDSAGRTWFSIRTSSGVTGWVASWYTAP